MFFSIGNIATIAKYGVIIAFASFIFYKGYSYYKVYDDTLTNNTELVNKNNKLQKDLNNSIDTANNNAIKLKEQEQSHKVAVDTLIENHKKELADAIKFTSIKDGIKNEKDGDIAPVLRYTIDRLFTKN